MVPSEKCIAPSFERYKPLASIPELPPAISLYVPLI
jgi:hypothetical protein